MKNKYPMVTFIDVKTVYIDEDVKIGDGTIIEPNVTIKGKTSIGKNNLIGVSSVIEDMYIGNENVIRSSYLTNSFIEDSNNIGPFSHIRGDSKLLSFNNIGNFVELKKVTMGSNNNAKHLTYLGDALIGNYNNFGAGTIIANYNSKTKVKSICKIGNNVSTGANCVLISPLNIKDNVTIAAGSVITKDVPKGCLAIARQRQSNIENYS
ncbi:MAG: hypothetical protein GX951_00295 [Mollicutes bacterium]|nr:hypothetical protein [Mollicutes bacterium]